MKQWWSMACDWWRSAGSLLVVLKSIVLKDWEIARKSHGLTAMRPRRNSGQLRSSIRGDPRRISLLSRKKCIRRARLSLWWQWKLSLHFIAAITNCEAVKLVQRFRGWRDWVTLTSNQCCEFYYLLFDWLTMVTSTGIGVWTTWNEKFNWISVLRVNERSAEKNPTLVWWTNVGWFREARYSGDYISALSTYLKRASSRFEMLSASTWEILADEI